MIVWISFDFFPLQSLLPKGTNLDLSNNLLLCLPVSLLEYTRN